MAEAICEAYRHATLSAGASPKAAGLLYNTTARSSMKAFPSYLRADFEAYYLVAGLICKPLTDLSLMYHGVRGLKRELPWNLCA